VIYSYARVYRYHRVFSTLHNLPLHARNRRMSSANPVSVLQVLQVLQVSQVLLAARSSQADLAKLTTVEPCQFLLFVEVGEDW
jgi:hypothetical protein